jgi:hypothetical protein
MVMGFVWFIDRRVSLAGENPKRPIDVAIAASMAQVACTFFGNILSSPLKRYGFILIGPALERKNASPP